MNPLYNSNNTPNNSTQPTKSVNRQGVHVSRSHNTFDMSYFNYKTQKFGQYEPFFVMEGVPDDKIPLSSSHNIRSLPMSSPFLSQLKLNKDYFMVPMTAILPNTWDYIYKNPSQGDDVPDDANCLFPAWSIATDYNFIIALFNKMKASSSRADQLRIMLILEMFLSQGSLLQQMGYHINPYIIDASNIEDIKSLSFDEFFDSFVRSISYLVMNVNDGTNVTNVTYNSSYSESAFTQLTPFSALSLLRNFGSDCTIVEITSDFDFSAFEIYSLPSWTDSNDFGTDINISRILAYQIACMQFYVNPQVDYLYNAQLYRDNLYNLYSEVRAAAGVDYPSPALFFDYNGMKVPYDFASKVYFLGVIEPLKEDDDNSAYYLKLYDYFYAIFGFRQSLKFGDYFTDSRTSPLAIGDDYIPVVAGEGVSVIDTSKRIVYQRFRNAVAKLGNSASDYLRAIFGTSPAPDSTEPKFISHQDFDVTGFEVANQTADAQGSLVTNLSSRDDTFAFEVDIDVPCVILGISYFSLPRLYMQTKDRHFFHRDRYDMFNPMLQYIGDQAVYQHERTDLVENDDIFGYQSRNNEYKQRVSIVSGGFTTKLPAWTFITDSMFNPLTDFVPYPSQSPLFIRAFDYEFNRFFSALSGYSMANSFHFIMVYNNKCVCNRPMEVNPNIL